MSDECHQGPCRLSKNVPGPFYTLGQREPDGTWAGMCMQCGAPENEAPGLLAPLTDDNTDTYFIKQPETEEEIEQACCAIEVCCVDALRYGGSDPRILARLSGTGCCDVLHPLPPPVPKRKWWQLWK